MSRESKRNHKMCDTFKKEIERSVVDMVVLPWLSLKKFENFLFKGHRFYKRQQLFDYFDILIISWQIARGSGIDNFFDMLVLHYTQSFSGREGAEGQLRVVFESLSGHMI